LEKYPTKDLKIEAAKISAQHKGYNHTEFALKNPLNLEKELLLLVSNQLLFLEKLPNKMPQWEAFTGLLAPSRVSFEQSSSEFTGNFKRSILNGKKGIDLTGGFGIDSFHLSQNLDSFLYIEQNTELSEVVDHNFKLLGLKNIEIKNTTAEEFLSSSTGKFDFVFLDPARRNDQNKKMVGIEDCQPNLLEIKDQLLSISPAVLVKYSPLLDLSISIHQLKNIHKIFILAEKNEVKEVLFLIKNNEEFNPEIECINLNSKNIIERFNYYYEEEKTAISNLSEPKAFLYEPNAAILKAGAFKQIGTKLNLNKLGVHSHLYTSDTELEDFPGRSFKIIKVMNFDKKKITEALSEGKANITCRNFPLKPEEIRKKIGIKDGGDQYLFFTEGKNKQKVVILCDKLH
jgi:16S rRNA G966 N2-methylase RsmD